VDERLLRRRAVATRLRLEFKLVVLIQLKLVGHP